MAVPPFRRAESVELLRARHDDLTAADADRVATALADLPLDVAAAGATLAATGMSAEAFLDALAEDATTDRPKREAAAWAVAFDRLAADDPPALALLTLVAWLGPEPVPTALFTGHPTTCPRRSTTSEPAAARRRPRRPRAGPRRRRQRAAPPRARCPPRAPHRRRPPRRRGLGGLGRAPPARRRARRTPTTPRAGPRGARLMPHVLAATDPGRALDDVAVEVGWLLHHAARFLRARGEQESARALLEDAHDLYLRRLGPDDPQTVAAARRPGRQPARPRPPRAGPPLVGRPQGMTTTRCGSSSFSCSVCSARSASASGNRCVIEASRSSRPASTRASTRRSVEIVNP